MAAKSDTRPKRPRGRPPVAAAHPPESAEFLTIKEVAAYFRVSVDTVNRMIYGTEDRPPCLDSLRVGVGNVRIPRAAVEEYKARNMSVGGSAKVSAATRSRMGMR